MARMHACGVACHRASLALEVGPVVIGPQDSHGFVVVDARGLRCPVNWAKAKATLEKVTRGTVVEVLVDDPRSERDLPVAAEAEGYAVLEIEALATHLRIVIER